MPSSRDSITLPKVGTSIVLRLFIPFALGYFLSFLYRTINAVIAPLLIAELDLTATSLGLLTSVYFLSFAGMQIPAGLLLDRFGPRRVQALLLSLAAVGSLIFAISDELAYLVLGRALIGAGVACSLMVGFSSFVVWLPPKRVPLAMGLLMAFGGLGFFVAGAPTELYLSAGGQWRDLFYFLALATALVALAVFLFVPNGPPRAPAGVRELLSGLRLIYLARAFWVVAPFSFATCGSAFALQGLWAGPWLIQVAGQDTASVGLHLSVMALALLAGSLACGPMTALAERFGFTLPQLVGLFGTLYLVALAGIVAELTEYSYLLWGTIGFLTNPLSLIYFTVSRGFDPAMAGRVNTGINALVLAGSFVLQAAIGWLIDFWQPLAPGRYPPDAFAASFGAVLLLVAIAMAWYLFAVARGWLR